MDAYRAGGAQTVVGAETPSIVYSSDMTENCRESPIANKTGRHANTLALYNKRDLTAAVEIARLQRSC